MNKLNIFNYEGYQIAFQSNDSGVMVNATQMSAPFRKRPGKWLELPSTERFIQELEAIRKSDRSSLILNGLN